eukprot:TRINITY_DN76407_c0_g1_i1.p1 TRINITY_DN76407_c0_g1~~TRINITY_DN76407_c0_g1_i1.p1  ORF type:complete len:656 (-),score=100.16 TRINITY_DN76407_c0_g1_i1:316-2244(-)
MPLSPRAALRGALELHEGLPKGSVRLCGVCEGRDALLADLEDLHAYRPSEFPKPALTKCLNACFWGPNCVVGTDADAEGKTVKFMSQRRQFERSLEVAQVATGVEKLEVPESVLRRAQLRSDSMRCLAIGRAEDLAKAEEMLNEAIDIELKLLASPGGSADAPGADPPTPSPIEPEESSDRLAEPAWSAPLPTPLVLPLPQRAPRLEELRLLRAEARGSRALARFDDAISDLDAIEGSSSSLKVQVKKATILRRAHRWNEALECFQGTLELCPEGGDPVEQQGVSRAWLKRNLAELKDRISEAEAMEGGEYGGNAIGVAGDEKEVQDSGNGSGWWKVTQIIGLSMNSCIYKLANHPPSVPHPFPSSMWVVGVRFGAIMREYTPVSTPAEWEQGRMDLVVKTYYDGAASGRFAQLMPEQRVSDLRTQPCWILCSAPKMTLGLPDLGLGMKGLPPRDGPSGGHLCFVVGGTGIAPALQALRVVADNEGGPMAPDCRATLLYSSQKPRDALMLDEIREITACAPERIRAYHTLTKYSGDPLKDMSFHSIGNTGTATRHNIFSLSPWKPFVPKSGAMKVKPGEEAGFRGRVTAAMLTEVLPPPGPHVRVVVSGPPGMWEDVRALLLEIGHEDKALVELKALTPEQC